MSADKPETPTRPSPVDPAVHLVIQKKIVADDLAIVSIQTPVGRSTQQPIRSGLAAASLPYLEHATATRIIFSLYQTKDQKIDFAKLLGPHAATLVDSYCKWGEYYSWSCHGRSKEEHCVDDGASANRCSDRCDWECSYTYSSWTPATCE